ALTLLLEPLDPATLLGRLGLRLRLRNTDLEFTLASIQRLPARGGHRTPDTLDRRLDLLDATSRVIDPGPQVVDRLLGNAPSLVEPGDRLRRIRALDLGPHLVHVLRGEVAASRHRQVLASREHLIHETNRLVNQILRGQAGPLGELLDPLDALSGVLSPVEESILALGERVPH